MMMYHRQGRVSNISNVCLDFQVIIVRYMRFKLTLLSPESEDHLKCCFCFQNMNMFVVITCDHWTFSSEEAEHIHVQVSESAFEVHQ